MRFPRTGLGAAGRTRTYMSRLRRAVPILWTTAAWRPADESSVAVFGIADRIPDPLGRAETVGSDFTFFRFRDRETKTPRTLTPECLEPRRGVEPRVARLEDEPVIRHPRCGAPLASRTRSIAFGGQCPNPSGEANGGWTGTRTRHARLAKSRCAPALRPVVPAEGIEPPTFAMSTHCSTFELRGRGGVGESRTRIPAMRTPCLTVGRQPHGGASRIRTDVVGSPNRSPAAERWPHGKDRERL